VAETSVGYTSSKDSLGVLSSNSLNSVWFDIAFPGMVCLVS
jgi:hypothetical protein